jgi:hypothetical protein
MMVATTNTISATLNKTISMLSITTMLYLLAFRSLISEGPRLLTPVPHGRHSREIRRRLAPVVFSGPPVRVSSNRLGKPAALSSAYPPNAKRPRLRRMVKPTLSKMLSTIHNRQPLPIGRGLPRGGHLHHEHHVFHERFYVG